MPDGNVTASPGLIAATRATALSALHGDGRLPGDQARLVLWLLDEAMARGEEMCLADSGGDEALDGDGWTDLPELAAEAIFGPGDAVVTGGENAHRELLGSAKRVCRSWRRAVSTHYKHATVRLDLKHVVPYWTAKIKRVVPTAKGLVLDLGLLPNDQQGSGVGAIAAASTHLRTLELRSWYPSSVDLSAIAEHLTNLSELRLPESLEFPLMGFCSWVEPIKSIAKITTLEVLEMDCRVANSLVFPRNGLFKPLGSLTRLRELTIHQANSQLLKADLQFLSYRLPQLAKLSLPLAMSPQILQTLRPLTNLHCLKMAPPENLMDSVPHLAELASLRSCTLAGNADLEDGSILYPAPDDVQLNEEVYASVKKALQVQELALRSIDFEYPGALRGMALFLPGLVEIMLDSVSFDARDLAELGSLQYLTKLDVLACSLGVGPIPEPGLQSLSTLREMEMDNITRRELGFNSLKLVLPPMLERVTLYLCDECFSFEEIVTALRPLQHLRHVALTGVWVTRGPSAAPQKYEAMTSSQATVEMADALPHLATITIERGLH